MVRPSTLLKPKQRRTNNGLFVTKLSEHCPHRRRHPSPQKGRTRRSINNNGKSTLIDSEEKVDIRGFNGDQLQRQTARRRVKKKKKKKEAYHGSALLLIQSDLEQQQQQGSLHLRHVSSWAPN